MYAQEGSDADVYLNVYDITQLNAALAWVGMGAHHSGLQVYNREYCFGRSVDETGVYHIAPKTCEGHVFRESVYLGRTTLTKRAVQQLVRGLQARYAGDAYHIVRWNCNDFAEEMARELLPEQRFAYPAWVNRPCRSALWLLPGSTIESIDQFDYEMFMKRRECVESEGEEGEEVW